MLRRQTSGKSLNLRGGEIVELRGREKILAILDDKNSIDGLPFMPEMLLFHRQQFLVAKRADGSATAYSGMWIHRNSQFDLTEKSAPCD